MKRGLDVIGINRNDDLRGAGVASMSITLLQEPAIMKPTRLALPFALAASLLAVSVHAAPTVNTAGGGTAVALDPEFTSGVQKLGLTMAPTFPARQVRGGGGGGDKPEALSLGHRGNVCGIQFPDIPGYPIPEIPKEICDLLGGIFNPKLDARLSITAEQGLRYRTGRAPGGNLTGIQFPIVSGEIDLQGNKGEIAHMGGLTLKNAKTAVNLSSFVIDTTGDAPVLTGLVKVNDSLVGRLALFDLTLKSGTRVATKPGGPIVGKLQLAADLKLSEDAAAALNEVFGVTAFTAGIPVGAATLASRTFDPDKGAGDKPDGDKPDGDKPDGKKRD